MRQQILYKKLLAGALLLLVAMVAKSQAPAKNFRVEKLQVLKNFQFNPGGQALGMVLKTDADGNAFWAFPTKDSLAVEDFFYVKKTTGAIDSLKLRKETRNKFWATASSGSDSSTPSYRAIELSDLPEGIGSGGGATPTWAQTLSAGSNLTTDVNVTSNDGISFTKTLSNAAFGNSSYNISGRFGYDFTTNDAAGNLIGRIRLNKGAGLISQQNASGTLTSRLYLQNTLAALESYNTSNGNISQLWIGSQGSTPAFLYQTQDGLRYAFPATKPMQGAILQAVDTIGTLAWTTNPPVIQTDTGNVTVNNTTTWFISNPVTLIDQTITLPPAPTQGQIITFNFGAADTLEKTIINVLRILPNTGQSIVGSNTFFSVENTKSISLIFNGSLWRRRSY